MSKKVLVLYDKWLLFSVLGLICLGLIMVASSSIVVSEQQFHTAFHYFYRQLIYFGVGLIVASITIKIPIEKFYQLGSPLLFLCLFLLVFVLVPGIGREVNGSTRWISLGFFHIQISEVAKLFTIIYLAGYLVRKNEEVRFETIGFIKPMAILGLISLLLLIQPDFGAAAVILVTALGMMFLAGVRVWHFLLLIILVGLALAVLAISSPYRLERLTSFLNPWANQFNSGYQLTQSLIAFGRGGWHGVGLGESVQKLFYLPEAHTDFLFAVLAEELGLIGILLVISLFSIFVFRAIVIGRRAYKQGAFFHAYLAYGFGLWVGLQAFINMGVNSGILPTKGLTLPLMSYGGSSMVVNCFVVGLLLRIDYEVRLALLGKQALFTPEIEYKRAYT